MSDVDDEELAALRAAALASLIKAKSLSNSSVDPPGSKNVAPISTVMASTSYSSYNAGDQSNYSSQYSWRNQAQNNRRGRGGRPFPKVNQRSNLIVITPIASEEKNTDGKGSTSQLVLPQHKWCQSINEDSSSPRSFKKTGPTRFNRHGSDSDSSDSEPDLSDNDSYSNETILQDEPSDHYATRSGRSLSPESSPEKSVSERRLSFQNIDSGLDAFRNMESTSVYKCLKNSHSTSDKRLELPSVENDSERSWKRGSDKKYPYSQSDNVSDKKHTSHEEDSSKTLTLNGEPPRKNKLSSVLSSETDHSSRPQTETFPDGSLSPKSNRSGGLSKNDLRLELKKRMQEMQQNLHAKGDRARSSSQSPPSRSNRRAARSRSRSTRRAARSHSRSTNGHRSRSPGRSRSRRRSHSLERRHGRKRDRHQRKGHSPSPVCDRNSEPTRSPRCNSKRNRSSSSDHSRKERSRSPRRTHRRGYSSSLDRTQKDRSRSPLRSRKRVDSPVSNGSRKNRSRSPRRKHRRDRSSSSDHSGKDRSRSPAKKHRRGHSLSSDDRQDNGSGSPSNQKSPPVYSRRNSHPDRVGHHGRRRKRSSSSSESSDSSRHSGSAERLRSVSSVVKPVSVVSKVDPKERTVSSESDSQYPREKIKLDRVKPLVSIVKSSVENKNSASDGQKRVPVHMRLGSLPGKRVIQMTKDVEAAFVNTSSDEGGDESNGRHKKDNSLVMYKANDSKNDESSKRHAHRNVVHSDTFKEGRFKHRR